MASPHLSLKARLRLGTILLVLTLVLVLAGLNLHRGLKLTFDDFQERALTNASQIRDFLLDRIHDRAAAATPKPRNAEETLALWTNIIRDDPRLSQLLVSSVANSRLVADIYIADNQRRILAAANTPADRVAPPMPDYLALQKRPIFSRLLEVLTRSQDYVISIPLSEVGKDEEIFSIGIVTSSILIADHVWPEFVNIGVISLAALAVSLVYTYFFSNLMLLPLSRVGQTIDRIAEGQFSADPLRQRHESREVADLQTKLGVLDQKVRGAREDVLEMRGNIEQLLQRMEEVVLLFDSSHCLLMAGRPVERLLGKPRSELTGKPVTELFHAATPIGAAIQTAIQFAKPLTDLLVTHHTPSGEQLVLLLSLDWSNGRILVNLRDVESRQELASHLDLSSRLTAINRVTGGVAHEIKNPLNAIAIHLEVLRSRLSHEDPETHSEVEIIGREISRLDRVVKGFLSFTRAVEVTLESLDLVSVTEEVAQLIAPQARQAGVEVVCDLSASSPWALADRDLVKQALLNITTNGIEAMPNGGTLTLRLLSNSSVVNVEVTDQGTGIPEDLRQKIFQLYFTTKHGGSGIGLSTTFQAIQLMGGSISMSSKEDVGTTFRLSFRSANPGVARVYSSEIGEVN